MERKRYTYNRVNCLLSSIIIFAMVIYIGSFIRQTFSLNFIKRTIDIELWTLSHLYAPTHNQLTIHRIQRILRHWKMSSCLFLCFNYPLSHLFWYVYR